MAKTVLVVDDEESLRELVSAILTQEGYNVIPASDGVECLEKLKTLKPDLIILDQLMPKMSGRETCERIRANPETKGTKILFLTAVNFSELGKNLLKKMDVPDHITKPFENRLLVAQVKKILR